MLRAVQLAKEYPTPRGPVSVLAGIDFKLGRGESLAVMGPSGSGKSTLLFVLGALDPPTAGTVTLDGVNPYALDERGQAAFRNQKVGFLFQDHCLLPQSTVLENVLAPTLVGPRTGRERARAAELLAQVGLAHRLEHRPAELSGGEQQRAALARALIREPLLLLCDEPTGNLDQQSAAAVGELLAEVHRRQNNILVIVTHSPELGARCALQAELRGRRLVMR